MLPSDYIFLIEYFIGIWPGLARLGYSVIFRLDKLSVTNRIYPASQPSSRS